MPNSDGAGGVVLPPLDEPPLTMIGGALVVVVVDVVVWVVVGFGPGLEVVLTVDAAGVVSVKS
jgi:hypothetical protein